MNKQIHTPYSRGILVLLCILFGVQIFYSIVYMPTWLDETEYLYSGWLILHENLTPYRDLFFRAPPFIYYLYGIPQYLLGTGLTLGRIESSLFFAGSLILLYHLAKKLSGGNPWAGLLALALLATNPYSVIHFATANPYSVIGFLFLAGLALFFSSENRLWRLAGAGLCIGTTALIRQNVALAVFWYILVLLLQDRPWRERVWGTVAALFPIAAGYGLFLWLAGDQMLKAFFIAPYPENLGEHFYITFTRQNVLSRFIVTGKALAVHFFAYILFAASAALLISRIKQNFSFSFARIHSLANEYRDLALIGGLFLAVFIPHFLLFFIIPFSSVTIYVLYSFHLAVLFIAVTIFRFLPEIQKAAAPGFLAVFLVAGMVLTPFAGGTVIDLPLVHPFKENDTGRLTRAAKTIREIMPPGSTVFAVDGPFFLLYPQLKIVSPSLLYRDSLWTKNADSALAQKYGFFNYALIDQFLKEADFYFEQENSRMENFRKTVHAVPFEANAIVGEIIAKNLAERYTFVARVDDSYPGRYKYTGNLLIYKRVK